MISENCIIYKNVQLGENVVVEPYVILGQPPKGVGDGEWPTFIGPNSHIRSHTVIYAGNKIGQNFSTGHGVNIREKNQIGDHVSIGTNSVIEHHIEMEDGVRCHSNVFVPEYSILKRDSWLGPNVVLTNAKFPKAPGVKDHLVGPIVGKNVKVGANSTVLPGVKLGDNCLIGAGSVVTKDIEKDMVAVGNPAKAIKKIVENPYR